MFELFGGSAFDVKSHTTEPVVTGTSVIAVKYEDGVLMACDTLGSYGGLARFDTLQRMTSLNSTLVGGDGDYSDFQQVEKFLKQLEVEDKCVADGIKYSPDQIFHRLTTLLYRKRSDMNPLWNNLVVAGYDENRKEIFLGVTDKIGTAFTADYVATGFGLHLAQPILAQKWRAGLSYQEALTLVKDCLRVCYYRDCRTINKILFARATKKGVEIDKNPKVLDTQWNYDIFKQASWD